MPIGPTGAAIENPRMIPLARGSTIASTVLMVSMDMAAIPFLVISVPLLYACLGRDERHPAVTQKARRIGGSGGHWLNWLTLQPTTQCSYPDPLNGCWRCCGVVYRTAALL